jgi:hypothetical protein
MAMDRRIYVRHAHIGRLISLFMSTKRPEMEIKGSAKQDNLHQLGSNVEASQGLCLPTDGIQGIQAEPASARTTALDRRRIARVAFKSGPRFGKTRRINRSPAKSRPLRYDVCAQRGGARKTVEFWFKMLASC